MSKSWFVHIKRETIGPLSTNIIQLLLDQGRLQFTDYICQPNWKKWEKILNLTDFSALAPSYPDAPIPVDNQPIGTPKNDVPNKNVKEIPIRRDTRVPLRGRVKIENLGSFEIINISSVGLFLKASSALPVGREVTFLLESDAFEKSLEMTGVVVREGLASENHGFAIDFTRVNPASRRVIQKYIEAEYLDK